MASRGPAETTDTSNCGGRTPHTTRGPIPTTAPPDPRRPPVGCGAPAATARSSWSKAGWHRQRRRRTCRRAPTAAGERRGTGVRVCARVQGFVRGQPSAVLNAACKATTPPAWQLRVAGPPVPLQGANLALVGLVQRVGALAAAVHVLHAMQGRGGGVDGGRSECAGEGRDGTRGGQRGTSKWRWRAGGMPPGPERPYRCCCQFY